MIDFWNNRYQQEEYIYGEKPNVFFASELTKLASGNLILPCEGEGRNAVFSATKGWNVSAFDNSKKGKEKAIALANKNNVFINYEINSVQEIDYPEKSADVVALIYAHLPPQIRTEFHQKAVKWLKIGGLLILEAFHPDQLNNSSGGPKDLAMLYNEAMLLSDFMSLKINYLETCQTTLDEGNYHQGKADIIRFLGEKI